MLSIGLLLLVATITPTSQDCIQLYSEKGYKLVGHAYKQLNGLDMMQCLRACKNEYRCQSINYKIEDSICELNNKTRESNPFMFKSADLWLHFDNPYKTLIGSTKSLPGNSCKEIRNSSPESKLDNREYWIDPGNINQPFPVYCDMNTDGGGWTLIASTVVQKNNDTISNMLRETDYRAISNFTINTLRIDVPAIRQLRLKMGFTQLRYHCYKKTVGRAFHIITNKNELGEKAVKYFTEDGQDQTPSCNSYFRGPGDTSFLASNCHQWGNHNLSNNDLGKWGCYTNNGTYRIYNDPAYWDGNGLDKYFVNFIPGRLCCDEDKNTCNQHLSAGDFWKIFVK